MVGSAPAGSRRLSAQELAAATPATRNRYADLLRVASIFVVVLGHWTMAVLAYRDGKFVGQNLLEIDPWTHILTWIFQVMPIFFIVGGFTNAFSWRSPSERGVSYADWLRARSARPGADLRGVLDHPADPRRGLWNMTAAVLAAVILLPTGLWPKPETLSTAWWWLRLGWVAACAVCLVPFLFAFRWAERPAALPPPARPGWIGLATSVVGAIAASGGMAIIADEAFPVQGEVMAEPALWVILLAAGALLLHVNPLSPLSRRYERVA